MRKMCLYELIVCVLFVVSVCQPSAVMADDSLCAGINARMRFIPPFSDSGKSVILVEDAHCQLPMQRAIMEVIQSLCRNLAAKSCGEEMLVLQEGSVYGPIDTTVLRSEAKGQMFDDYLASQFRLGRIGAAEMLHARFDAFAFWGIEDSELYDANFEHFMFVAEREASVQSFVEDVDKMLDQIRALVFSVDSSEVYEQMRVASEHEGLVGYIVGELRNLVLQYEIDMNAFPVLNELYAISDQLSLCDKDVVQQECVGVPLQEDEVVDDALMEKWYKGGVITIDEHPMMFKYMRLKEALLALPMEGLIVEKDALEKNLLRVIAISDEERELVSIVLRFEIMKKLLTFHLTRNEYRAYVDSHDHLSVVKTVLSYVLSFFQSYESVFSVEELDDHAHGFYKVVQERDDALARNIVRALNEKGVDSAIAVVGGFHSEGIAQRLVRQDIGVTILSPSVSRIDDQGLEKYHDVMRSFWGKKSAPGASSRS